MLRHLLLLSTALSVATLAMSRVGAAADAPPTFVKVALETGKVASGAPAVVRDVLVGEVPGIRASLVSLGAGGRHREGRTSAEDKVHLVLAGRGAVVANGAPLPVEPQMIVRLPVGWETELQAAGDSTLDVLVLRHTLSEEDRADLEAHPGAQAGPYVRKFAESPHLRRSDQEREDHEPHLAAKGRRAAHVHRHGRDRRTGQGGAPRAPHARAVLPRPGG